MRPIVFDVNAALSPPQMTICFPGRPHTFVSVRIKSDIAGRDPKVVAVLELRDFTPEQLQLLAEVAKPMPIAPDPAPFGAMIEKLEQEERYAGSIFCPACCAKLGHGNSPAIGYVEQCPSCKRRVTIRFTPGVVTVVLWAE